METQPKSGLGSSPLLLLAVKAGMLMQLELVAVLQHRRQQTWRLRRGTWGGHPASSSHCWEGGCTCPLMLC